jgi:hypothetical protein
VWAEVQELAWAQITGTRATGLILNAIVTQTGMTAPVPYRYVACRDGSLAVLILPAYRERADRVEAAAAAGEEAHGRLSATGAALRSPHPRPLSSPPGSSPAGEGCADDAGRTL